MRLTCLFRCGLELKRFKDVRSEELGEGEEVVLAFEGGGEEVVEPEGEGGGLTDEEIAVVVGAGGGGRVAGSVRRGE